MNVRRIPLLLLLLDVVVCAIVALAGGNRPNYYFYEGRFITWLNAAQIVAACIVAIGIYRARTAGNERGAGVFWILVALGSAFLAVDEIFEIHENLGMRLREAKLPRIPVVNGWGDVVLIAYGLAALAVCLRWRREIAANREALLYLALGGALLVGSELIDIFGIHQGRERDWWSVAEESQKVLGFAAILGGLIIRWIDARRDAVQAAVTGRAP